MHIPSHVIDSTITNNDQLVAGSADLIIGTVHLSRGSFGLIRVLVLDSSTLSSIVLLNYRTRCLYVVVGWLRLSRRGIYGVITCLLWWEVSNHYGLFNGDHVRLRN